MTTEETQIDIVSPVADEVVKSPVSPPNVKLILKHYVFVEASKVTDEVAFLKAAFGAEEVKRKAEQEAPLPLTVELKIGGTTLTVADHKAFHVDGVSNGLVFMMEVKNVVAAVEKAAKAGSTSWEWWWIFRGSRMVKVGKVADPFGHTWMVAEA